MNKLNQSGNIYGITSPKAFKGVSLPKENVQQAIDFSYNMVYGEGHHRATRTGGQFSRKKGEKFCNTFQGKLAEIVLYNVLKNQNIGVSEIDFSVHGEGIWDDCDLMANGKKINIKSAANFSNLLLLEQNDWNCNGQYIPDLEQGKNTTYDFFVLLRFKPDVKYLFRSKRLLYSNDMLTKNQIEEIVFSENWSYDFAGSITNDQFKNLIVNGYILPQNALLNGKISMDASNIYCQSGDMCNIEEFIKQLN